jgi:ketosteroid isomerase-like protein
MSTEANIAILKDAYKRWSESKGGSIDHWLGIVDDGIDLRSLAEGAEPMAFTERRSGRAQVESYLRGLTAEWEMIDYQMNEYVAQGDRVVAIGRAAWRNKATGKAVDSPKVDIWRFRDGKAVEFFELYDTAKVFACACS